MLTIFVGSGVISWFALQKVSVPAALSFLVPGVVYLQTRGTFVQVEQHGLTIRSHASSNKDPILFAWSEITDAVVLEKWWRCSTTVEVRAGQRFGWIHVGMIDGLRGFVANVRLHADEASVLARTLQSLERRERR